MTSVSLTALLIIMLMVAVSGFQRGFSWKLAGAFPRGIRTSARLATGVVHQVGGIDASEVHIDMNHALKRSVVILEATAQSQEDLVDAALEDLSDQPWAEDPYGAVLWPSARLVSEHLLKTFSTKELEEMEILELGTGTGLVSLSAALGGAKNVHATDYNPLTLQLLETAIKVNGVSPGVIKTSLFDCKAHDTQALPLCDLLLVADLLYEPATAVAVAKRVVEAITEYDAKIIIGDSPNRPGRPLFISTLLDLLPETPVEFATVPGQSVVGERHDLISDKRSVTERPHALDMGLLELNC